MKTEKVLVPTLLTIVALIPLIYLLIIWDRIPSTVALHYDANFKPNRYGNKSELWFMSGLLTGISLLVYFLLINIQRIDPKQSQKLSPAAFRKIAAGVLLFMTALNLVILFSVENVRLLDRALLPLIGLLFAFLGNYMYNIKPNYLVGVRVPWTLSSDENWKKTHMLAGKMWFVGGLLIVVMSLFLRASYSIIILVAAALIMGLVPVIYSFMLYKKGLNSSVNQNTGG